ncbi:beta-ACP synthase [Alsobacter soli]|uniref:Nodulation protein E n=1 Tax=Alsobacter soli TaxID=2109933 RepID=A0A2T1HXV7_9HYPH|nr:beta-ketoacyl-[acyl-carrier-protein] synthase family protein [Alsobacter soli]PSC06501.1 beta-ACP synthase [Alsobacter soli]
MRRVAVTGVGAVSACGLGAEALWRATLEGRSGVREVLFPAMRRQQVTRAAKLPEGLLASLMEGSKPRFQDPVSVLALAAAREAVEQAGLGPDDFGSRCAVVWGTGFGGAPTLNAGYHQFISDPGGRFDPMTVPKVMANAPASWIGMAYGATGPTYCISTACASATQAIGLGTQLIRGGLADRCIVGGAESPLVDAQFQAWESLHVMSATECRPFSAGRDGMMLGEGAGVVVLESAEAARERGAHPLAEVAGYGATSDAADLLRPDVAGAAACMRQALADAGIEPSAIGYVNAHGTGTVANDMTEAEAIRSAFGPASERLLVSSTKPVHGHALGAAGALEFIVTLFALREQTAPPTLNFTAADPRVGIEPVPHRPRIFSAEAALTNSFAFGGVNASLVLTQA